MGETITDVGSHLINIQVTPTHSGCEEEGLSQLCALKEFNYVRSCH